MAEAGKDVKAKQANVEKLLRLEEEQFARTLERGLSLLDEALTQVKTAFFQEKLHSNFMTPTVSH